MAEDLYTQRAQSSDSEDCAEQCTEESIIERETIERVRCGSKEDFRILVETHQSRVFAAIVRQGVGEQIAKELTQEVFLKAFLNIGSFRFEASFSTWILRIAINHTSSYFSSKRYRQKRRTVAIDKELHRQNEVADCYDREAIVRLKSVISMLEPRYREVLVLCAFEGKAYKEVSELLGIPIGTVRSRLHKARLKTKAMYFNEED